jgi:hypothetical protein
MDNSFYTDLQKLNERKSQAAKGEYLNEEDREKWLKAMKLEVMSSDESAEEDGEEILIVYPLPWLSVEGVAFKNRMDAEKKKEKSSQALRQTKRRVIGSPSTRLLKVCHLGFFKSNSVMYVHMNEFLTLIKEIFQSLLPIW